MLQEIRLYRCTECHLILEGTEGHTCVPVKDQSQSWWIAIASARLQYSPEKLRNQHRAELFAVEYWERQLAKVLNTAKFLNKEIQTTRMYHAEFKKITELNQEVAKHNGWEL